MAKHDSRLDRLFAALGDPTRRAILERLARGEASVSELAHAHAMALPSFMKHLRKLEQAGLITSVKKGRVRACAMSPDAFSPAQDWLSEQQAIWEARLDRLDAYATKLARERENGTGPQD